VSSIPNTIYQIPDDIVKMVVTLADNMWIPGDRALLTLGEIHERPLIEGGSMSFDGSEHDDHCWWDLPRLRRGLSRWRVNLVVNHTTTRYIPCRIYSIFNPDDTTTHFQSFLQTFLRKNRSRSWCKGCSDIKRTLFGFINSGSTFPYPIAIVEFRVGGRYRPSYHILDLIQLHTTQPSYGPLIKEVLLKKNTQLVQVP